MRPVALVVLALLVPSVGRGQAPPRATLGYARGPGAERCPDESALRAAVAARLGYDPFGPRESTTVRVDLRRGGQGLRARIELGGAAGEPRGARELSSRNPDCAVLASALELAIAIAIDPLRIVAPSMAAAPPAPAKETALAANAPVAAPAAAPVDVEDTEVAPLIREALARPGAREPIRWRASLGGVAALGTSSTVVFGFTLGVGLRWRFLSLALEGRGDIPDSTGSTTSASLVYGALVPCGHVGVLAACALLAAGAQVGTDTTGSVSQRVAARYLAAGGRLALEIPWGIPYSQRLAFAIHGDVLAPLVPTVLDRDGIVLSRLPSVSFAFGMAIVAYFR